MNNSSLEKTFKSEMAYCFCTIWHQRFNKFFSEYMEYLTFQAVFDSIESTRTELRAFRYYSPTDSFIQVTTSTAVPMVTIATLI